MVVNTSNPGLRRLDLNLLAVFDAVMRERSVTRAGQRLGLSQSAVSHAVNRLRHALKDELFVRSSNGIAATPRAEQLALPIREALDGLQQSLAAAAEFDPASTKRTFRIAVDNYSSVALVGPMVLRISRLAPSAGLEFYPTARRSIPDIFEDEADLAIGPFASPDRRFVCERLMSCDFAAVMREKHPATRKRELTVAEIAGFPRLEFTSVYDSGGFEETFWSGNGLQARSSLRVPFLSAAPILAASDRVALVPRKAAIEFARHRALAVRSIAGPWPKVELMMVWQRRLNNEPANRWLRANVIHTSQSIGRP